MSRNLLKERFEEKYSSMKEFCKLSGIPLSCETTRTTISGDGRVTIPSIMIVALYLGFLPSEIEEMIYDKGDRDFSKLIGSDETYITPEEEVIISIFRKIKSKDNAIDQLALVAKADNINITRELNKLRRK